MDIDVKEGRKTTEFWITVVVTSLQLLLTIFLGGNIISEQEYDLLGGLVVIVVSSVLPVLFYVNSRTRVKSSAYRYYSVVNTSHAFSSALEDNS